MSLALLLLDHSCPTSSPFSRRQIPLLARRGIYGIKKFSAKPSLAPQTGWSLTPSLQGFGATDHPVRSKYGRFAAFSYCRLHPSSRGTAVQIGPRTPPGCGYVTGTRTPGVASLNPELISCSPPGCVSYAGGGARKLARGERATRATPGAVPVQKPHPSRGTSDVSRAGAGFQPVPIS